MNRTSLRCVICAASAALAAASSLADYSLAYHGKLVSTGSASISTKVPMTMEFRLYLQQEPGETAPLWGRSASVRFEEGGLFYVELSDASGAAVERASYERLADAIASANGADVWISVTPAGYGELLPRKPLGGVHRAEHVSVAAAASFVEAKELSAETLCAKECAVGGALNVKTSFVSAGGSVANTFTGRADVSVGTANGTAIVTGSFGAWRDFGSVQKSTTHMGVDSLIFYSADSGYGAFSIPVQQLDNVSDLPSSFFKIQSFIAGNYNPFF